MSMDTQMHTYLTQYTPSQIWHMAKQKRQALGISADDPAGRDAVTGKDRIRPQTAQGQ